MALKIPGKNPKPKTEHDLGSIYSINTYTVAGECVDVHHEMVITVYRRQTKSPPYELRDMDIWDKIKEFHVTYLYEAARAVLELEGVEMVEAKNAEGCGFLLQKWG